jgi:hypothetical protein
MMKFTVCAIARLLILAFGFSATAFGAAYQVGTCLPILHTFTTISAAVAGVPPGSIIDVCPGTYNEIVTISQPLTLRGVTSADGALIVISGPIPVLEVSSASPVNISNIEVQPSGPGVGYVIEFDGASGTLSHVSVAGGGETRDIGVFVNNGSSQSVSIKESTISTSGGVGIEAGANPGTLALTIQDNTIVGAALAIDIGFGVTSTIQGNFIDGSGVPSDGITSPGEVTISGNTIVNNSIGIISSTGDILKGNNLTGNGTGISVVGAGTYMHNSITNSAIGIDLGCNASTASANTFNSDPTAFNNVPSSFGTSTNKFYSVSAIEGTACP